MSNGVELDLTHFINSNLTWKTVKKGRRSGTRRPRKLTEGSLKVGVILGNKISKNVRDSSVSESEKLGVAVLGQHFAEKVLDIPIKKRRLLRQSPSPPPRTPSLNREGSLSPQPQTPSPHHEESEQLGDSKCASGQWYCSDSYSKGEENNHSFGVDGGTTSKISELTTKEFCCSEDFSGIALLAAAACHSSIDDRADHVESSGVEALAAPEGIELSTTDMKETIASSEAGSLVQDIVVPVLQNRHHDKENDKGVERSVPLKKVRFHWDLNKVMDEWEEPCYNPLVDSPRHDSEGMIGDALQCENLNLEGCEARKVEGPGDKRESIASDVEISAIKLDKVDLFLAPGKREDMLASPTSIFGEQADVTSDLRGQVVDKVSSADIAVHDFPASAEPNKITSRCCDQLVSEDPHCDCRGSEVPQDEPGHLADGDNVSKVQEGYDSPFEDGELREPIVYAWEEKEVEEREIERVDFDFDNDYKDEFDTGDYSVSEKIDVSREDSQTVEKTSSLVEKVGDALSGSTVEQCVADDFKKPSSLVSLKTSGWYQSREHYEDVNLEGNNSNLRRFRTENKNGHDEIRTSRGNMLHNEGSSSFNVLHGIRSDDVGDADSRAERDFGSDRIIGRDRFFYQGRGRNEVDSRWVDSSVGVRDSRNHYGYPRPRNIIGDSAGKSSGLDSHDDSQSRSYASRGMYRPFNRKQSPSGRHDSYDVHRGTLPMRGFSRDRSRGRAGFIPQGFRRGPQEEYHEHGPYYVERKGQGFSPNFRRDAHISRPRRRSRSRSRSRTRSPIAWNMRRERPVGTRRHSPDFRPEARVQGERFPVHKPNFSGDFEGGFVSPPRGRRLSPHRISRCFDERKCMDGQYRDRRSSPVRMFRRNPRFDSGGYPGRLKSDDHFRPMTRPGRFSHIPGAGRGTPSYDDGGDHRRKSEERYETMNRVRRYETGSDVRRFRYDAEDYFEPRNSRNEDDCFRSADRRGDVPVSLRYNNSDRIVTTVAEDCFKPRNCRNEDDCYRSADGRGDVPVSTREERDPSSYNSDRFLTTVASSPGERDNDADASPKEV